jgi:hypothetical protein
MSTRINLKITLSDGDYWYTGFNGTIQEASSYFMGVRFEKLDFKGKECLRAPVVKVEEV